MFFVQPYDTDRYEFDTIEEAINCAWKKLSLDEQNAIIDDYDSFNPEDEEHYNFEDWLSDHWGKYLSDYIIEVQETEDHFVMGIPSYSICYLINGDSSGLSDEDIKNIDDWVDGMRKEGKCMDISPISGRDEYFDDTPPFGLPCSSMDCWINYL